MRVKLALAMLLTALAAVLAAHSHAADDPDFEIGVGLSRTFGDTHFELNALAENPAEPGELVDIRSRLEFPLDLTMLGLEARWTPAGESAWSIGVGAMIDVSDPGSNMIDEDWIGEKQFAYTESDGAMDVLLISGELRRRLDRTGRDGVALLFRFDYERIEQSLVGFEGWQASLFSDTTFAVSGSAPTVDYRVCYFSPRIGAAYAHRLGRALRTELEGTAGVVFGRDSDDHLLRGRLAEGSTWGPGLQARLLLELFPGLPGARWLTVQIAAGARYYYTRGEVTQRWYRNEDQLEGTVIPVIPYELASLRASVGLWLGAVF